MSTLVRTNGFMPSTSFFDDFFTKNLFDLTSWTPENRTVPRVNIIETNDNFKVEMAAPGMNKNDFQIELDNETLIIQSNRSVPNSEDELNYTLWEFSYRSFKRSFHLPNTVEADKIDASYRDGILSITIPKKEEAKRKPARTITIK